MTFLIIFYNYFFSIYKKNVNLLAINSIKMSITRTLILIIFPIVLLSSCNTQKITTNTELEQKTITLSGEVTAIVNGKDGYTATIKDKNGAESYATISIINLQKSNGNYKSCKVGDAITVTGEYWKDAESKIHIIVNDLN
jgi:hypothetical protein